MYPRLGNAFGVQFITSGPASSDRLHNLDADENGHSERPKLSLIGASPLLLEFLLPAFSQRLHLEIAALPAVDDWLLQKDAASYDLLILFVPGKEPRRSVAAAKGLLDQLGKHPPFAVLADCEEADEVLAAFEFGARAYIPTSATFDVIIELIKLVLAGGTYYPPCVLSVCGIGGEAKQGYVHALTPREMAVLQAVRHGLPNKLIAQELGISESTIKVHVHRLMKKLKVQNRTQAALRAGVLPPVV